MTLKEFEEMVRRHDLTFAYSDDHRHYTSGHKSLIAIRKASKEIPRADAIRIWNSICDEKLNTGAEYFYWF